MTLRRILSAATATLALSALPLLAGDYVTYDVDGTAFEGYLATPEGESRGTVLIVHDWDGMTEYEERRADMLAEAGYTAFAIDVYGADTDPQGFEEYRALSGALYGDRETFRERLMGSYCFGGAAVLEAARAGADLDAFVSFHGGLPTPEGQDWSMANGAPIKFFHGSADPVSGIGDLAVLMEELNGAGIPHSAKIYGGARHSFTVFGSGDYLEEAEADSWTGLLEFLGDTL
jgi:dienelactone hydrolase